MNKEEITRIKELKQKIKALPKGYISTKNIGGSIYYYHQWSEDGKKFSKYISEEELLNLDTLIKERQELEQELKSLKQNLNFSFSLMHQNTLVADLLFDDNGLLRGVSNLYSTEHLPIGCLNEKGDINISNLLEWWNDRSLPLSRSGVREALDRLNIDTPQYLLLKCFGLSLSDQYWIKPKNKDIRWEDINFFDNVFSEDVGELLFGKAINKKDINLSSPDNTSVGNLKKKWKIIDGKRVLVKGGSNPFRQEPYNEVIAYKIASALGLTCVPYEVIEIDGYPYSVCEDFINENEDLVPAHWMNKVLKKNNNDSAYTHLLKCANKLGIKDFEEYLNKLIVFDYIIANEDRHFNNFGVIRDSKTLSFVGPAPIFDNGSSFGFNKVTLDVEPFKGIETKPFKTNIIEQLKLVSSFKWVDVCKLNYIKENIYKWFEVYCSKYLDKERIKAISDSVNQRIDYLIQYIAKKAA